MEFDEAYYRGIWPDQGVHRHDYVSDRASMLVLRYGVTSYLDIGCGCGALIKELRNRGCDAWGLEISDYALENSCAPGYVLKGSVTDIPYRDNRFEVVTSQGLWSYVEDVLHAVEECYRVGRFQEHNIDYLGAGVDEENFATAKPREWWDEKLPRRILLTCPVHLCKEYSMQRWIDAVKAITYPHEVFVVDNSPNGEMVARYGDQIPMEWLEVDQANPYYRITRSMEVLRQKFLNGNYYKWFNLEIDVIPDPDVLDILLKYDADWVGHAYPQKGEEREWSSGIGCSLLSRRLAQEYNFNDAGENSPDGFLWEEVRGMGKFKTVELWGFTKVRHLAR